MQPTLVGGGCPPHPPASVVPSAAPRDPITLVKVLAAYQNFAESDYLKNGRPTNPVGDIRHAVRPLRDRYGVLAAAEFGKKKLKAVWKQVLDSIAGNGRWFGHTVAEDRVLGSGFDQWLSTMATLREPMFRATITRTSTTAPLGPIRRS